MNIRLSLFFSFIFLILPWIFPLQYANAVFMPPGTSCDGETTCRRTHHVYRCSGNNNACNPNTSGSCPFGQTCQDNTTNANFDYPCTQIQNQCSEADCPTNGTPDGDYYTWSFVSSSCAATGGGGGGPTATPTPLPPACSSTYAVAINWCGPIHDCLSVCQKATTVYISNIDGSVCDYDCTVDNSCNAACSGSTPLPPTPTPSPTPVGFADPIGTLDAFQCNYWAGWACDPQDTTGPIDVQIYASDPNEFIGQFTANLTGEAALSPYCGGTTAHRFVVPFPVGFANGNTRQASAYGINVGAGNHAILNNSPLTLNTATCLAPTNTPLPSATPTPLPGFLRANARVVSNADALNCAAIYGSSTLPNSPVTFNVQRTDDNSFLGERTQTDSNMVGWDNQASDNYRLHVTPPPGYTVSEICWSRSIQNPNAGTGAAPSGDPDIISNETLWWYGVGLTQGSGWTQVDSGDVYAETDASSPIPASATDRVLIGDDSDSNRPGLLTYGSTYDLDPDTGNGEDYVSSQNWIANEAFSQIDFYELYFQKFDLANSTPDYTNPTELTKPATGGIYYVSGDMTTSSLQAWSVGAGESYVFVVTGNLTINQPITITGSGFVSFIVQGSISIDDSVGVAAGSTTPVVEGVYICNGTFGTGTSGSGTEKFVGHGTFIANNFSLQRDLESVNANTTTPAELFIYDPQLPLRMPDEMKDFGYRWEEVAP